VSVTPPTSAAGEVVGMALERPADREELLRSASGLAAASPSAIAAAESRALAPSGIRLTKRNLLAGRTWTSANARTARFVSSAGSSAALTLDDDPRRRP
jgi:hypothetical protein